MHLTPLEAYERHVKALSEDDIDGVVDGYAEDAVMVANDDVFRGREAMRALFERSRGNSIIDRDLTTKVTIEGGVVYVSWRARQAGQSDLAGVDTFLITDGLISVHTGFYVSVG